MTSYVHQPIGRGHIDFGADLIGVGFGIGIRLTLSFLHNIL